MTRAFGLAAIDCRRRWPGADLAPHTPGWPVAGTIPAIPRLGGLTGFGPDPLAIEVIE